MRLLKTLKAHNGYNSIVISASANIPEKNNTDNNDKPEKKERH